MEQAQDALRSNRWKWIGVYLCLLLASQLWTGTRPLEPLPLPSGSARALIGAAPGGLSALRWTPGVEAADKLPILLLHGSPGDASNFADLAPRLAGDGRDVLAFDLPGFGGSASAPGGRSIEDHARAALAAVPWSEFHVAAWSMGGGVALHMAQLAPKRVHSLSLIASIGVQEAEGSGSYFFEHLKYALMWTLLVPGGELIPHFGVLGPRSERISFCRNFWESDQRPLRGILSTLRTPLFLAQGRNDFLVPLWCAAESHALANDSRLVIFEGSHFLLFSPPFGQLDLLAPELLAFLGRHDPPGVPEPRSFLDISEAKQASAPEPYWLPRHLPWMLAFAALTVLARWRAGCTGLVVGGLVAMLQLDFGLGVCAGVLGTTWRATQTAQGSWKSWIIDQGRLIAGTIAASIFAVWAEPQLCALVGPWGGLLATLALPLLAVSLVPRLVAAIRRWHADF